MKWSETPFKTLRQDPASAVIKSHILLLKTAAAQPLASGLFIYGPFMVRALQKLEAIIRGELNKLHLVEIFMPMVQPKDIWEKTGRWQSLQEILQKIKNSSGQEFCLGPTHEEAVCVYAKTLIQSWRDLPFHIYQIQTKYRDELRPRFGLLRAREFSMKDAYSFDLDKKSALESFEKMEGAYHQIFSKLGVRYCTAQADSGLIGGDHSKEFHILADEGEDRLMVSEDGKEAFNLEISKTKKIDTTNFKEKKGIEAGHIFYLGSKYSKEMGLSYLDREGKKQWVQMGCYGIGLSRTIQALIEQSHDEEGMLWPEALAPFRVHLLPLKYSSSKKVKDEAQKLYTALWESGMDAFMDDREVQAGVQFKDADLLGLPLRLTIGERDLEKNQVTATNRKTKKEWKWDLSSALENIQQHFNK